MAEHAETSPDEPVRWQLPENADDVGMGVLLNRLQTIEGELQKDAVALLTKAGVGLAGLVATSGAILSARDTLWWRASTGASLLCMGNRAVDCFGGIEILLLAIGFGALTLSYLPARTKMPPDVDNWKDLDLIAAQSDERSAKALMTSSIQYYVSDSEAKLNSRTKFINVGISCLVGLVLAVGVHAYWNGSRKYESDQRDKVVAAQHEASSFDALVRAIREGNKDGDGKQPAGHDLGPASRPGAPRPHRPRAAK